MTHIPRTVFFFDMCSRFVFVNKGFVLFLHSNTGWVGRPPPKGLDSLIDVLFHKCEVCLEREFFFVKVAICVSGFAIYVTIKCTIVTPVN